MGIGRIPFYDVFIFAVSVHIPDAHIVGMIFISLSCGRHASLRFMKGGISRYSFFPDLHLAARLPFPCRPLWGHCIPVFFPFPGHPDNSCSPSPSRSVLRSGIPRNPSGHACVGISAHFLQNSRQLRKIPFPVFTATSPLFSRSSCSPEHLFTGVRRVSLHSVSSPFLTAATRR